MQREDHLPTLIFPHHLVGGDILHMIYPDALVVPHRQVPGSASHQQNVFLKIEESSESNAQLNCLTNAGVNTKHAPWSL